MGSLTDRGKHHDFVFNKYFVDQFDDFPIAQDLAQEEDENFYQLHDQGIRIVNGLDYFEDMCLKLEIFPTQIASFDDLFASGGINSGEIIEIIGRGENTINWQLTRN